MSKKFCICRNCGNKFDEKDAIKVKRGYKVETHCPKCDSFFINGYIKWTDDFDSEITTEIEPLTETKSEPKFKAGDRVFNKVTRKWVNIIEFDIETGLYIVRYDDGIKSRSLESELRFMEDEIKPEPELYLKPKFKVGNIIAKAHLRFRIVKVECDRYIVEGMPGINLEVFFTDQDKYRLVKEEGITTVDKAAEVFAEMLVELCPELLGFDEAAKEWENEFRKKIGEIENMETKTKSHSDVCKKLIEEMNPNIEVNVKRVIPSGAQAQRVYRQRYDDSIV